MPVARSNVKQRISTCCPRIILAYSAPRKLTSFHTYRLSQILHVRCEEYFAQSGDMSEGELCTALGTAPTPIFLWRSPMRVRLSKIVTITDEPRYIRLVPLTDVLRGNMTNMYQSTRKRNSVLVTTCSLRNRALTLPWRPSRFLSSTCIYSPSIPCSTLRQDRRLPPRGEAHE